MLHLRPPEDLRHLEVDDVPREPLPLFRQLVHQALRGKRDRDRFDRDAPQPAEPAGHARPFALEVGGACGGFAGAPTGAASSTTADRMDKSTACPTRPRPRRRRGAGVGHGCRPTSASRARSSRRSPRRIRRRRPARRRSRAPRRGPRAGRRSKSRGRTARRGAPPDTSRRGRAAWGSRRRSTQQTAQPVEERVRHVVLVGVAKEENRWRHRARTIAGMPTLPARLPGLSSSCVLPSRTPTWTSPAASNAW